VFNPVLQGQRFDPRGDYVRRWVPELREVRDARVHEPWKLDPSLRRRLEYAMPIVNHAEAAAAFRVRRR
jgi:deoxyribodipyrimidine photo-lyase